MGVDLADESVAAADALPVGVRGPAPVGDAVRAAPGAVVLQASVHLVVATGVDGDVVELSDRHVVVVIPRLHPVPGDVDPAVVAEDHVPAVFRVDPQRVVIDMHVVAVAVGGEGLPAVGRAVQGDAEDVHVVRIGGIDADLTEVHRARVEGVDARPALPAVEGAIHPAVLVPVGSLLLLGVAALPAETTAEGAGGRRRILLFFLRLRLALLLLLRILLLLVFLLGGAALEGEIDRHRLLVPRNQEAHGVPFHVLANPLGELAIAVHEFPVHGDQDVPFLEAREIGGAVLGDRGETRAHFRVLAAHPHPRRVLRLLGDPLRLDHRVDDIGIRSEVVEADAAESDGGQAFGEFPEARAAVGGLVERRPFSPLPRGVVGVELVAAPFVGRDEQGVRIVRVHLHVDHPGVLVDVEHLLPAVASVGGAEEPPLFIRTPEPAERSDPDDVGIGGVDAHGGDLERPLETHVLPRRAAVDRLVDAVPPRDAVTRIRFPGADPYHVRVRRAHVDRPHRGDRFVIELVLVVDPVVGRLQHPARRGGEPVGTRIGGVHHEVGDPPTHVRGTDRTPRHRGGPLRGERPLDRLPLARLALLRPLRLRLLGRRFARFRLRLRLLLRRRSGGLILRTRTRRRGVHRGGEGQRSHQGNDGQEVEAELLHRQRSGVRGWGGRGAIARRQDQCNDRPRSVR